MKKMIKSKKRYVTLLETLIAMSLLSLLLVVIFGFFREISAISNMTESKQDEAFEMRYVESRMAFLFERLVNENAKDRKFYFYCEPPNDAFSNCPSLVFTYNNEVRADPLFSGDVIGRLYVDKQNNLCLATWPIYFIEGIQTPQKEVLMNNVHDISFKLYAAPIRLNSKNFIDPGKVDPNKPERDRWYENEWPKVFKEMPSIIKIEFEIVKKDQEQTKKKKKKSKREPKNKWEFAFVLPSSQNPLYYPPN